MADDVVLAATDRPLPIEVRWIEDERVPTGMMGMGTYLNNRLIARCAVPPEVARYIESEKLFATPVQLVLAAQEDEPGLQCRLFAVVDVEHPEADQDSEGAPEPWEESVPKFEPSESSGDEPAPQGMVFLGQIVRFAKDRRHPDSLPLETADILRKLIQGETVEVVDRLLDDLLGGDSKEQP